MPHRKNFWTWIIVIILAGFLAYLLLWRWRVSATRFFDVDEFSYMHWTAQVARGERMYTDFFSYFTPGFMWAFAPIFWIYGVGAQVFTAARTLSFIIFLGILAGAGVLFGLTRGWKWALLPAVILAFLPMPYDKFLEIRPDNLATLLAIIGVIGEIWAIREKKNWLWLVSGLAYSASLFVLVKTLPIVAVGGGIALLSAWKDWKKFVLFLLGLFGPWILFFLSAWVTGHFESVWYSLTRLPFEAYRSAENLSMEANLFFYPNASFYGGNNYSITLGFVVNHAIWILAIIVGAYRLVTPVMRAEGKKERILAELLIGLTFFILVYGYVKYFPAKHSQYLIPIAIFVSYYAADGLSVFFDWLARIGGYESLMIILVGFMYLFVTVTKDVNGSKLLATNTMQLTQLSEFIKTIPLNARVVDMEGRMVFWKEGYPICCMPIDSVLSIVTRAPSPLAVYLAKYPADYIWDGDSGRLGMLSPTNIAYIHDHFVPVDGWAGRLWKRK